MLLLLDTLHDLLRCQRTLGSVNHLHKPFNLLLVCDFYLFVRFHLKIETFRVIDPINSLWPRSPVTRFLEHLLVLHLCRPDLLIQGVYDQIVIFRKYRYHAILFQLSWPRQLLYKLEKLFVIDCVPLCQTAHIQYSVQNDFFFLKNAQNLFSNHKPVVYLVKSRNVQNSELYEVIIQMETCPLVKVRFFGYLF